MTGGISDEGFWAASPPVRLEKRASLICQLEDFLCRRWIEVAGTTSIVLLAALVALHVLPPRYSAHATILLDPRRDKAFGPDDAASLVNIDASSVESAIAQIKGNLVLMRVVRAEHLAGDPEFNGSQRGTNGLGLRVGALFGRHAQRPASPELEALGALDKALRVERVSKGYVLSITVTAQDAAKAARLANAVADGFVGDQRDARLEASRREATFFAERLAPLGEQLRRSEDAVERFRRDHNLLAKTNANQASEGSSTLSEQQLGDLSGKLATARTETAQAWAHFDEARALTANGGSMETIPDVVRSNLIAQLRQQQAEVARKEADLAARYSDSYPSLINARAERREIERSIVREMARIVANLKGAYNIAKSQEDALRASVNLMTGAAGLDNDLGRQLRDLERVKLVDQTVFETYLARAKAAEQRASFEEHDVRVISPATEPVVPAFPQTALTLFCATLLGLGLGAALGCALDALDPGFTTPHDAEQALGVPVLAAIPWMKPRDRTIEGRIVDPCRLLAQRPRSRYAEAMHAVRAGLTTAGGRPARVTLVTSSVPDEGKTMLALSLAISATLAGLRVLILDADLRHPSLSRSFGFENRLGLVDMLSGLVGTEETTVPIGSGLWIMPSGRTSAIAPDLFASPRMAVYLDHVRRLYDLVIIDAAPVDAVIDAAVLSGLSDRILFVVGWRDTAREVVARSLQRLRQTHKLAGLVLNKVDERKAPQQGGLRLRAARAYKHYADA